MGCPDYIGRLAAFGLLCLMPASAAQITTINTVFSANFSAAQTATAGDQGNIDAMFNLGSFASSNAAFDVAVYTSATYTADFQADTPAPVADIHLDSPLAHFTLSGSGVVYQTNGMGWVDFNPMIPTGPGVPEPGTLSLVALAAALWRLSAKRQSGRAASQ